MTSKSGNSELHRETLQEESGGGEKEEETEEQKRKQLTSFRSSRPNICLFSCSDWFTFSVSSRCSM